MRWLLALVLLALPGVPLSSAQEDREPWWDERWHFRMPMSLSGAGADPVSGEPARIAAEGGLVLVPIELGRSDVRPGSIRLVVGGAVVPSRLLPISLAGADAALAVVLPGGPRPLAAHVYFDVDRRPSPPESPADAAASARLDGVAGLAPGVRFVGRVPAHENGDLRLLVLPADGPVAVRAEVATLGASPERILEAEATGPSRFPLPAGGGFDLTVVADGPAVVLVEAVGASASPSLALPSLDGGLVGHRFAVPDLDGLAEWDIVATSAASSVVARDAATGRLVATLDVPRLATRAVAVPEGGALLLEASSPVLVFARGRAGLVPGATLEGAAQGEFLVAPRSGSHTLVASAPVTAAAFPLERPSERTSGRAGDPPRWTWRSESGDAAEPWAFSTPGADATLTTGESGAGAFPGRAGLAVRAVLPSAGPGELSGAIVPFFPSTAVRATARTTDGTAIAGGEVPLPFPHSANALSGSGDAVLAEGRVVDVEAERPVAVFAWRVGDAPTFALPSLPPVAVATVGVMETHGSSLRWDPPVRIATARSGEEIRIALGLVNEGREPDGSPRTEEASLALLSGGTECAGDWDASIETAALAGIASPGRVEAFVLVRVPADAMGGSCSAWTLRALSARESGYAVEARVVVRARSAFEPQLAILDRGQSLRTAALSLADGPVDALVSIRNAGGRDGAARLAVAAGPGYTVRIARAEDGADLVSAAGAPASSLPLAAGESALLRVRIEAKDAPPWEVVVEASSVDDPAARDEVSFLVSEQAAGSVRVEPSRLRLSPPPAGSDRALLAVRSAGEAEVRFRVGSLPTGWSARVDPARILLRAPGVVDTEGRPLDRANVTVEVEAPADARLGDVASVAVFVETADGSPRSTTLTAVVANDFAVDVTIPPALAVQPRSTTEVALALASRAAGPFDAHATLTGPDSWNVALAGLPASFGPGESGSARLRVEVPPGAEPGAWRIQIRLTFSDAVSPQRTLDVSVDVLVVEAAVPVFEGLPASLALAPGEGTSLPFRVLNAGNVAQGGFVEASSAPGIRVAVGACAIPAPNEATSCALSVTASPAGFEPTRLGIVAGETSDAIDLALAVRDLRIARLSEASGFLVVEAENVGTSRVRGVTIELAAGSGASFEFGPLAPGDVARHPLPVAPTPGLVVRVRSADDVPDAVPGDNEAVWPAAREAAPEGVAAAARHVVPAAAGFAALALAAIAGRRGAP